MERMKEQNKKSVVIPVYNTALYLGLAEKAT